MSRIDENEWDRMADWAESDAPLSDDSSKTLTGAEAREAGARFPRGRPNVGRAHASGDGQSRKRATRLDEQTDAALVARAKSEGRTVSAVMRELLRRELIKS